MSVKMNTHSLMTLPISELNKMKKESIINLIADFRSQNSDLTLMKTSDVDKDSLLNDLTSAMKPIIQESLVDFNGRLEELQEHIDGLTAKLDSPPAASGPSSDSDVHNDGWTTVTSSSNRRSFSDVLRNSVRTVFQEERCKCDVIISKAEESANDAAFLAQLCEKMNFPTKPGQHQRLGKISTSPDERGSHRPRLLKATFSSAFDARSFMARYEECRKEKVEGLPVLRLRSGKSKEEREAFGRSSKEAHKLNEEARKAGKNESFSLRDDASIWKFTKKEDGAWVRDRSWRPANANQGN